MQRAGFLVCLSFVLTSLYSSTQDVEVLLAKHRDERRGVTQLHRAAVSSSNINQFIALLRHCQNYNDSDVDECGQNAFHWAVQWGAIDVADFFIGCRAFIDINLQDISGRTPLHYAVLRNCFEIVYVLRQAGVKRRVKDIYGCIAYDYAQNDRMRRFLTASFCSII